MLLHKRHICFSPANASLLSFVNVAKCAETERGPWIPLGHCHCLCLGVSVTAFMDLQHLSKNEINSRGHFIGVIIGTYYLWCRGASNSRIIQMSKHGSGYRFTSLSFSFVGNSACILSCSRWHSLDAHCATSFGNYGNDLCCIFANLYDSQD